MWSSHVPFMGKAFSSFSCTALLVAWHSQWKKQRERETRHTLFAHPNGKWKLSRSRSRTRMKKTHTQSDTIRKKKKKMVQQMRWLNKNDANVFFLVVLVLECQALLGSGGVCSVQCESARCDSIQFSTCIHNYAIIRFPRSKCLLFFFVLSCFTFQRTTQRRN